MSLGDWVGTAALVVASTVALWLAFNDRLNAAVGEVFASRLDGNELKGRFVALEPRLHAIELGQNEMKANLERVTLRLEPLEQISGPTDIAWDELILAVAQTFEVVHARLEWHLSWLERLTIRSESLDHGRLLAGDSKLSAMVVPRLFGMELCSLDEAVRTGAAQSVADGVGDRENYASMGRLMVIFPDLHAYEKRLGERLLDGQAESAAARRPREPTAW